VAQLVKTVLTEEERRNLKVIALELLEIRKLLEGLAETLVKLSDKELLKALNASKDDFKENQVDAYREKLEKQVDLAEKEFQP
jgi:hypothetical protein